MRPLLAALVLVLLSTGTAAASPEVGLSVVTGPDQATGGHLQVGWLVDRFRIAAEGMTSSAASSAGGSVGFVLFDGAIERANGVERARGAGTIFLEAVAQREWWSGFERTAYGGGAGVGLRGRSSRAPRVEPGVQLFARVLAARIDRDDMIALRTAGGAPGSDRDVAVLFGLGVTFGENDGNW